MLVNISDVFPRDTLISRPQILKTRTTSILTQGGIKVQACRVRLMNPKFVTNLTSFRLDPRFDEFVGQGMTAVIIDTGIDVDHPFCGPDADHNGVAAGNNFFTAQGQPGVASLGACRTWLWGQGNQSLSDGAWRELVRLVYLLCLDDSTFGLNFAAQDFMFAA